MINISDLLQATDCDSQEVPVWVGLHRWRPFLVNIHIKISLGPFGFFFFFFSRLLFIVCRQWQQLYCFTGRETIPLFVCRIFVSFNFKFHKDLQLHTEISKFDLIIHVFPQNFYPMWKSQSGVLRLLSRRQLASRFSVWCSNSDDVARLDLSCGYQQLLALYCKLWLRSVFFLVGFRMSS